MRKNDALDAVSVATVAMHSSRLRHVTREDHGAILRLLADRRDELTQERGDRFAAHTGFDPRVLATPYRWFRVLPRRVQARREVDELPDRELMRDGRWLA